MITLKSSYSSDADILATLQLGSISYMKSIATNLSSDLVRQSTGLTKLMEKSVANLASRDDL